MHTLPLANHRVENDTVKRKNPRWMMLHGGIGPQRYSWCDWAAGVTTLLTSTGQWVATQEGDELHIKHRSKLEPAS